MRPSVPARCDLLPRCLALQRAPYCKTGLFLAVHYLFSTTIDPRIVTEIEYGLEIDLDRIRLAKTLSMSEEDQRILGDDLSSVFPGKGLIGLQAAPKLHNIIKIPKLET